MNTNEISQIDINKLLAELEQVKAERDAAINDLTKVLTSTFQDYVSCDFCEHYVKCLGKNCENYIEGKGCTDENGKEYPNFKWSCEDFNYGTCDRLINTPCNGCDFSKNFKYKGLKT